MYQITDRFPKTNVYTTSSKQSGGENDIIVRKKPLISKNTMLQYVCVCSSSITSQNYFYVLSFFTRLCNWRTERNGFRRPLKFASDYIFKAPTLKRRLEELYTNTYSWNVFASIKNQNKIYIRFLFWELPHI